MPPARVASPGNLQLFDQLRSFDCGTRILRVIHARDACATSATTALQLFAT